MSAMLCFILLASGIPVWAADAEKNFSAPVVLTADCRDVTITGTWNGVVFGSEDKPSAVITVKKGYAGVITLDDVSIGGLGEYVAAIKVETGARPIIMLKGTNRLASGGYRGGIEVADGARVDLVGNGMLQVRGGAYGAGIGGGSSITAGTVNIANYYDASNNLTRIYATGGASAAGIGGGYNGGGGTVTVEGGYVLATGSGDAQNIGRGAAADGRILSVGVTNAYGGRLVNHKKVDWSPKDTGEYREVKLKVHAHRDDLEYHRIRIKLTRPHEQHLNVLDIPDKQGLRETDVSYLYIPESKRVITISIDAREYEKLDNYMYGIKDNEPVNIYLDQKD